MSSSATYVQIPGAFGDYYQAQGYSHAVIIPANARLVCTAGEPGLDLTTGKFPTDPAKQIEACLDNCDAALRAAGITKGLGQAHKVLCFLTDTSLESLLMEIWRRRYPDQRPAFATVGTSSLVAKDMIIEMLVEAYLVDDDGSTTTKL